MGDLDLDAIMERRVAYRELWSRAEQGNGVSSYRAILSAARSAEDVPDLVTEVRELRAEIQRMQEQLPLPTGEEHLEVSPRG